MFFPEIDSLAVSHGFQSTIQPKLKQTPSGVCFNFGFKENRSNYVLSQTTSALFAISVPGATFEEPAYPALSTQ